MRLRSKRSRVSGEGDENTIKHRVSIRRYNTIQEFLSDVEKASAAVIDRKQSQSGVVNGTAVDGEPLPETVNRIATFKKKLNSLLHQASSGGGGGGGERSNIKAEKEPSEAGVSTKAMNAEASSATPEEKVANAEASSAAPEEKVALTFIGNYYHPKQLFSSLQSSSETSGPLPNGVTTVKVAPRSAAAPAPEKAKKFGETFAPRPSLPPLEMTRLPRLPTKAWIDPFDASTDMRNFPGETSSYSLAYLPAGNWLQYGGVTSSPSYWRNPSKRQQPPLGQYAEANVPLRPGETAVPTEVDDVAPLLGVYSSFAPSFDSAGALIQEDSKDLVWWNMRGEKRLNRLLSLQGYEDAGAGQELTGLDENSLEESVNAFKPEEFVADIDESVAATEKDEDPLSKETDSILREVSDLLETLTSYQRIRNLDLVSASIKKPSASETTPMNLGAPSAPSEAEHSVYEMLKSSLLAIVSTLPPYAVAKLDGDQLAELNISQKLIMDSPDYHGTMERDDFTLQQERAAIAAAQVAAGARTPVSTSSAASAPASSRSRVPSQPATYAQRLYTGNPRSTQPTRSYYGTPTQHRGPGRPPGSTRANYIAAYASQQQQQQQYAFQRQQAATPTFSARSNTPQQYAQPHRGYYNAGAVAHNR